jgi:hypothetical protein
LRLAVRAETRPDVDAALAEFAALAAFGPAGAGGVRQAVHPERRVSIARIPRGLAPMRASLLAAET